MTPRLKLLSEEVVRWALEVKIQNGSTWKIAFTNPTAGPWKRVTAENQAGKVGEVHRFEIEEKRPDLIVYSDVHKVVLIIEAKTDISGLQNNEQIKKTAELFKTLSSLLRKKETNEFWRERANYNYQLGLLWSQKNESSSDVTTLATQYVDQIERHNSDVLCFQGNLSEGQLSHRIFWAKQQLVVDLDHYHN